MPRSKSPRRKQQQHRPKSHMGGLTAIGALHFAAEDKRPLIGEDVTDISVAAWLAFDQMTAGQSNENCWGTIVFSINVALMLAEQGFGEEYSPYLVKALDGLFRAQLRAQRTKAWRFDGEAIIAVREALEIHGEQIKVATKENVRQAIAEVKSRILADNVYKAAA